MSTSVPNDESTMGDSMPVRADTVATLWSQARERKSFSVCAESYSESSLRTHSRSPVAMMENPARSRALLAAATWVTISRQSRPCSIMVIMPPIWPCTRLSRLSVATSSTGSMTTGASSIWYPEGYPLLVSDQPLTSPQGGDLPVSYTHLRAHETVLELVCRLLLAK